MWFASDSIANHNLAFWSDTWGDQSVGNPYGGAPDDEANISKQLFSFFKPLTPL